MKYLLDSNVISELRKRPQKMDARVLEWAKNIDLSECFLSSISVLEIEMGILLLAKRDAEQAGHLRQWFESDVLVKFHWRILPVDVDVAREAARLHVPNPSPQMDALIGATASVNGCTLVTRNARDFENFELDVINPWDIEISQA
ncbi:twitching motility protein PilT [Actinomycetota bacterium]|nr:twitching motility protein PilT [Actinomycetota bacterium]